LNPVGTIPPWLSVFQCPINVMYKLFAYQATDKHGGVVPTGFKHIMNDR